MSIFSNIYQRISILFTFQPTLLFLLYIVFYFVAFSLSLLNNGLFWDDWVIFNSTNEQFIAEGKRLGNPFSPFFFNLLTKAKSLFLARAITFISFLSSSVFTFLILRNLKIRFDHSYIIMLLSSIAPLNFSRNILCVTHYSVTYLIFFFAFYIYLKCYSNQNILGILVALFCFFISFFTNSILFLYPIVLGALFYKDIIQSKTNEFIAFFIRHLPIIFTPFLFLIFNKIFFPRHEAYNQIIFEPLRIIKGVIYTVYSSFFMPLFESSSILVSSPFIFIFVLLIYLIFIRIDFFKSSLTKKEFLCFFIIGGAVFFLGCFPYILVKKYPNFFDFNSRHQLLLPLGLSITLFSMIGLIPFRKFRIFVLSFFIVSFISLNVFALTQFITNKIKNDSIVLNLADLELLQQVDTVVFTDLAPQYNVENRAIRFYEYSALLSSAFNDYTRLGVAIEETLPIEYYLKFKKAHIFIKDWQPKLAPAYLTLKSTNTVSPFTAIKLRLLEIKSTEDYSKQIKPLIQIAPNEN
ncbi:MAG: hypothetical protein VW397_08225 [Candidatus Margulisiibacteriota bacterium]